MIDAGSGVSEMRFRAMGCAARVVLVGGAPALIDAARGRIDDLEARWSRFRQGSELNRLGDLHGRPVVVSEETLTLVERAVRGWTATGGLYDPTVGGAVAALGYDRSFEQVLAGQLCDARDRADGPGEPSPGCAGIEIDPVVGAVTLPAGVRIDAGGIGKGLACDIVATEMISGGAYGVLVELGGDLRVAGSPPDGHAWRIAIEDPFDTGQEIARVALLDGAVATSSTTWRRWVRGGRPVHHIIDPFTGDVSSSDVVSATVVAGEGWWAEVLAKAAFVAGLDRGAALVADAGATGLLIDGAGAERAVEGFDLYRDPGRNAASEGSAVSDGSAVSVRPEVVE